MTTPDERLNAAIGAAGTTLPDAKLDALARAAREELAREPKARSWWLDGLLVLALNLVMGLGGAAMMSWSDLQHGSQVTKLAVGAAWFVVMALGSVAWLRPGASSSRWAIAGGFVVASLVAVLGASGFDPGLPFLSGMVCAFAECKIAIIPVALVVWLSTRFAAQRSHVIVGALASASGGALALHFHCPNGTVAHVLVFHVLPAFVLAGAALVVRHFVRPRSFVP